MAANPAINLDALSSKESNDPEQKIIRKGKVGDWRNYMSDELARKFDEWSDKKLKNTGLIFDMNEK